MDRKFFIETFFSLSLSLYFFLPFFIPHTFLSPSTFWLSVTLFHFITWKNHRRKKKQEKQWYELKCLVQPSTSVHNRAFQVQFNIFRWKSVKYLCCYVPVCVCVHWPFALLLLPFRSKCSIDWYTKHFIQMCYTFHRSSPVVAHSVRPKRFGRILFVRSIKVNNFDPNRRQEEKYSSAVKIKCTCRIWWSNINNKQSEQSIRCSCVCDHHIVHTFMMRMEWHPQQLQENKTRTPIIFDT